KGINCKYYPAYHCNNHGHYFCVTKDELEDSVDAFINQLIVPNERVEDVMALVRKLYDKLREEDLEEMQSNDDRIDALRAEAKMVINKLKVLSNQTALTYLEQDLERIEKQILALEAKKDVGMDKKDDKIERVMTRV